MAFSLVIIVMSIFHIPPVSWVFDLNQTLKESWVTSSELEPPFGHAEEVSLAGISRRMGLDLEQGIAALRREGFSFSGPQDSLEKIARANDVTPMEVYAIIRLYENKPEPVPTDGMTVADVEARYAGTGLGQKTLAEVCNSVELAVASCVERLSLKGYNVETDKKLKQVANQYDINPIDILKMLLVKDYKPEG
jgi:hypothetical protein